MIFLDTYKSCYINYSEGKRQMAHFGDLTMSFAKRQLCYTCLSFSLRSGLQGIAFFVEAAYSGKLFCQ